jgi:Uma2 family endonuclease
MTSPAEDARYSTRALGQTLVEDRCSVAMVAIRPWTLEELHRLPDDGNKYELVRGELFVTPAPAENHEMIAARITRILVPYVERNRLGLVLHPRAVFRWKGSEAEPDLMVRQPKNPGARDWDESPMPILIVEILSPTTRRRDLEKKRPFYMEAGIPEYWIVDPETSTITRVRPAAMDETFGDRLPWSPSGAREPLIVDLAHVFS